MHIQPGQLLLDRYRIDERLGSGGMGEVWRARDQVMDREVALKVLGRHLVGDDEARARFRREARLAGSLNHDHVVAIHDASTDGDVMVLAMELVGGGTLATRLDEAGRFGVAEAVRITSQILSGLAAAHEAGLVHRDVKPCNVMFTRAGAVKLNDFGLARPVEAVTASHSTQVHGSAPYIAPERARGRAAVPASDVYAVGCMLYEMLTGVSPFLGETPAVTIARHLQYDPPQPSATIPDIPLALDAVLRRALAKDPAARYPDAGAMLADLRSGLDTGRLAAVTVARYRRPSRAERRVLRRQPDAQLAVTAPDGRGARWLVPVVAITLALAAAVWFSGGLA